MHASRHAFRISVRGEGRQDFQEHEFFHKSNNKLRAKIQSNTFFSEKKKKYWLPAGWLVFFLSVLQNISAFLSKILSIWKKIISHIPFIQEQYFSNRNKLKPKRDMFLNFRNNIISYRNKFRKRQGQKWLSEEYFYT